MIAEPVVRVERRIAEVFVHRTMNFIGSLLGRDLDDSTRESAELGAHVVGRHAELLHRILRRNQRIDIVLWHVRTNPVDEEEALAAEATADLVVAIGDGLSLRAGLKVAAATVGHGVARCSTTRHDARNEIEQIVDVATIEGRLSYLPSLDHAAKG